MAGFRNAMFLLAKRKPFWTIWGSYSRILDVRKHRALKAAFILYWSYEYDILAIIGFTARMNFRRSFMTFSRQNDVVITSSWHRIFVFPMLHQWMRWYEQGPKHFWIIRTKMVSSAHGQSKIMDRRTVFQASSIFHIKMILFTQKCIRKGKENYLFPLNFWTIAFVSCFTEDRLLVFAPSLSRIETWLLLIDLRYSEIQKSESEILIRKFGSKLFER